MGLATETTTPAGAPNNPESSSLASETSNPGAPCLDSETWEEAPQNPPPIEALPHGPTHSHAHHHHTFLEAFQSLVYVIIVALFIITFTAQPFRIPSASMEPTLLIGDFLLVDKEIGLEVPPHIFAPTGQIHHGDLIVFHFPVDPSMHLVKRVVGLPGDHLRLHDGRVILNGIPLAEPYAVFNPATPDLYRDDFPLLTSADPTVDSRWWIQMHSLVSNGELTVPANSFFVLGDNRNNSEDSRYWGLVPRANIVGKPFLVYFSLNDPTAPTDTVLSSGPSGPHQSASTSFARWNRALHIIR